MEVEAQQGAPLRGRRIKKKALKNKALAVSFNEKDLKDYVTGFHKRKKKRRKEANKQVEEAQRRKRIELRKKRKLERESVYGEATPADGSAPDEGDEHDDDDEESNDTIASVSGTKTYDSGNLKVTVTTSAISREDESPHPIENGDTAVARPIGDVKKHNVPVVKKKPFKKVANQRSRPRPLSKRDKRKAKTKTPRS